MRLSLDRDSDKFRCFDLREKLDSTIQPKYQSSDRSWHVTLHAYAYMNLAIFAGYTHKSLTILID